MNKKFIITLLTNKQVVLKTQFYATINGKEYKVGEEITSCYINCDTGKFGRKDLKENVDEKTYNTIMVMWGDTPTVEEKTLI